ncbi:BofL [Staphylococcus phage ZCSS1]|uniref:Uncharacterized protein n=1 Tax=Staphylococcus phage UHP46 TaxID=3234966 RepID=A0AB39C830_9CAUD|nr:BofL [Staphylococcus phage ZCSS1]
MIMPFILAFLLIFSVFMIVDAKDKFDRVSGIVLLSILTILCTISLIIEIF